MNVAPMQGIRETMQEMSDNLGKPACHRADACAVVEHLRKAGYEAYFAGGCVRDELWGLQPKDFDVATSAPPKKVRELFDRTQAVGAAFGVILVRWQRSVIEVATFRTEFDYQDGRRPSVVKFATAQEDAQRRDFTINGLFLDPADNRVIDYVGGQADLRDRLLRAIGVPEERFAEDHLRLLRAVRFSARFDLQVEPTTAAAMLAHAPLLKRISPERIADELRRMLTAPTRHLAWQMLWHYRLAQVIFRFMSPRGVETLDESRCPLLAMEPTLDLGFGLILAAACLSYRLQSLPPVSDLAAILTHHEITACGRAMRQALKVSNEELDEMEGALAGVAMILPEPRRPAVYKRFAARPTSAASVHLLQALRHLGHHVQRIDAILAILDALQGTEVAPPPLITGDDLKALGLPPGPRFKRILDEVYDAQLEGAITTRSEAELLATRVT